MSLHGKCSTQNKQMRIRGLAILFKYRVFFDSRLIHLQMLTKRGLRKGTNRREVSSQTNDVLYMLIRIIEKLNWQHVSNGLLASPTSACH